LRDRESNIFLSFFSPDDLGLKAYFEFDGFWGFIWDFMGLSGQWKIFVGF